MNPLIRKLERFTRLSDADKRLLQQAASARIVNYDSHQDIIAEGEEPNDVNLILGGWVCRYKQLADGGRQIMSFLLPGDLCDLNIFLLRRMDHALGTLTPGAVAKISRDLLDEMLNAVEHANFFENRATEYSRASTIGTWEEAFAGNVFSTSQPEGELLPSG